VGTNGILEFKLLSKNAHRANHTVDHRQDVGKHGW
jgi:hypothetical protein